VDAREQVEQFSSVVSLSLEFFEVTISCSPTS
jgi:hypothetical protein